MLSCSATCRAILKSFQTLGGITRHDWSTLQLSGVQGCRFMTTSTLQNKLVSPRQESLTLLHKLSKCIPSALGQNGASSESTRSIELWDRILSQVFHNLSTTDRRPIRIVFCGLDEWSGSQELVTALLADPFSSNENYTPTLCDRWTISNQDQLHITYASDSKFVHPSSLLLSSPYLTQFSVPVELIELRTPLTLQGKPLSVSKILEHTTLSEADIPILVCNPLVTSLSTISACHLPSNSILVFSAAVPQEELTRILEKQLKASSFLTNKPVHFVAIEPRRAANAAHSLQEEPNSLSAIQRYQDDILSSQISQLTSVLHTKLLHNHSEPASDVIRTKLALCKIEAALNACYDSLQNAKSALDAAFLHACTLREQIEEHLVKTQSHLFENKKAAENEVAIAMKQAHKEMMPTMDLLTWWRLLWRVDEISSVVSVAVSRIWCHDLEKKLILKTGELSALQHQLSDSAFKLLAKHPIIQTAVLTNELSQLQASPTYHLSPESLTRPIHFRRNQLIEYPTNRLHITGQKVVLGMTGGVATGVGVSWAGWFGWLLGSGEGVFGFMGTDANTAIGVGMLLAIASVRWGMGSWEKAKKHWWQDWTRVGEGFERDLKAMLDRTMRQQVTVVSMTACQRISDTVKKRDQEIAEISKELDEFRASLDSITAKLSEKGTS